MHSPIPHGSCKPVHAESAEPRAVVAGGPVPAPAAVLGAGEQGEPFVDEGVDRSELLCGVAHAVIVPPAPQDEVEAAHDAVQIPADVAPSRLVPDLAPDRGHGPG